MLLKAGPSYMGAQFRMVDCAPLSYADAYRRQHNSGKAYPGIFDRIFNTGIFEV